jgi:hypothetical protein
MFTPLISPERLVINRLSAFRLCQGAESPLPGPRCGQERGAFECLREISRQTTDVHAAFGQGVFDPLSSPAWRSNEGAIVLS